MRPRDGPGEKSGRRAGSWCAPAPRTASEIRLLAAEPLDSRAYRDPEAPRTGEGPTSSGGGSMRTRLHGWRALAATLAAVVALAGVAVTPAAAITNGTLDNNAHPYVGLMTAHKANGDYLWRCTGTLLNANVFLTAGH